MNTNPYIESPAAIAAKAQNRAAFNEWRNSFTPIGWESHKLQRRQRLIAEGAAVRPDDRLEIQVTLTS